MIDLIEKTEQKHSENAFLDKEEKHCVFNVLTQELGLDAANAVQYVDGIEKSGCLYVFGAGSLLDFSHLQTRQSDTDKPFKTEILKQFPTLQTDALIKIRPACIKGLRKDFVCYDTQYRGTRERPGITIGMERDPQAQTQGGVLETCLQKSGLKKQQYADFIIAYLRAFKDRESPADMPIYAFSVEECQLSSAEDGEKCLAIICVADTQSSHYAGALKPEEKARLLAEAAGAEFCAQSGREKAPGTITALDYMRNAVRASMQKQIPVEQHILHLYGLAVTMRYRMDPVSKKALKEFEVQHVFGTKNLQSLFEHTTPQKLHSV